MENESPEVKHSKSNQIIVSLTSFPKRIGTVHIVIETLLRQTMKPDRIILWLSNNEFPDKEALPNDLTNLVSDKFRIMWCEDLKPHKKYYYALIEYPNDIVITVDDDCIYPLDTVEKLYNSYIKHPKAISTMRARLIDWDKDENLMKYEYWTLVDDSCIGIPAMDLVPIGMGGVLYPPDILNHEVFNIDYILNKCLYTDDLWLKVMHSLNLIPTVLSSEYSNITLIDGTQEAALWINNIYDNNDRIMEQLLNDYNGYRDDGKKLIDILKGKYGYSLRNKIKKGLERERAEMLKFLESWDKLIIFGAGKYASKTYCVLKKYDRLDILCFLVTDINNNPSYIDQKAVLDIRELGEVDRNSLVIIATAEKHHEDIIETLLFNDMHNYFTIKSAFFNVMKY